jgi:riboflavin kinase/FMN adenylyltransferase
VSHDVLKNHTPEPSVVAIGVFDGVHRGHQMLISKLVEAARVRNIRSVVVTFDPHPATVLAPHAAPQLIETVRQRCEHLRYLGVDEVLVLPFDVTASQEEAVDFVDRVLVNLLRSAHVVIGEDFRFGRERFGDVRRLTQWGGERGFSVESVSLVGDGERFSSTAVRAALSRGDIAEAERILGHAVVLEGSVIHGDARGGAELGFPTANLELASTQIIPGTGIYAGASCLPSGEWMASAISVGTRPQFYDGGELLVEVFVVNFSGNLYGEELRTVFLERLRGEMTFPSVDELVEQMSRDVGQATLIFEEFSPSEETLLAFPFGQRR